jgi:Pellino
MFYSYNGYLPQGDRGRRRSKFILYKRSKHNGVKRSKHYIVQSPETSQAILDTNQHSISYTLSRNQAVIVEYQEDENTDMFQVNKRLENAEVKLFLNICPTTFIHPLTPLAPMFTSPSLKICLYLQLNHHTLSYFSLFLSLFRSVDLRKRLLTL